MGIIKADEIRGYEFENELICTGCVTPEERKDLEENEILTESEMNEEDYYFCDRCEKEL